MNSILKYLIFSSLLVFLIPAYLYRTVYFNIVVDVAAIIYLVSILNNKIKTTKKDNKSKEDVSLLSRFDITPIGAAFFAFLAISVLAVIFSADIWKSFWGYPAGHSFGGGLFIYIHYFLFFVIVAAVFKKKEEYINLLNAFVAVAAPISIYGIYERFIVKAVRPSSLFGNPIHLGAFSLFVIYFSAYLFLTTEKKILKVLYAVSAFLAFLAIYVSESRGPFLGLVGSLVVAVPFLLMWGLKKIKNKKIVIFSIAALVMVLVSGVYFLSDSKLISRFKNISADSTVSNRVKAWEIAIKGIKEKPILGWGQENFDLVFNKYFNSSILSNVNSESWFDRAHNNILDIWVTIGTFGLLAYFMLWSAALWAIYNLYKKKEIKEAIISFLILIAYFINNLTFFDVIATFIPFVLVIVFLNNVGFKEFENRYFKIKELRIPEYFANFLVLLLGVFIVAGIQLARGSSYYYSLKTNDIQLDSAVYYHDKLVSLMPSAFKKEAIYSFVWILNTRKNTEFFNKYYNNSLDELKGIISAQPMELRALYYTIQLYLKNYEINNDLNSINEAEIAIEKALSISPNRQDLYVTLAQIDMQRDDFDSAINHIKKAEELNPKYPRSYFLMSIIYFLKNQFKESEEQLIKAKEYGITFYPADSGNLFLLANYYLFDKKDYDQTIFLLEGVLSRGENLQARKKLAALYAETGNKGKAIKYAKIVRETDPNGPKEANNFIKTLGGTLEDLNNTK